MHWIDWAIVAAFCAASVLIGVVLRQRAGKSLEAYFVSNRTLMHHLTRLFAPVPVHSIEGYGIPAQAKEPVAFAFLAWRALQGRVNHLPETTGARQACILGAIIGAARAR